MNNDVDLSNIEAITVRSPDVRCSDTWTTEFVDEVVTISTVDDVAYLPAARTQIIQGRYFPVESGFDDVDLRIMQTQHGGSQRANINLQSASAMPGQYCVLSNPWSKVFSHWIEELTKVVVLEAVGFEGVYVVPLNWSVGRESMAMLGVTPDRLLDQPPEPVRFECCVFLDRYNFDDASIRPARFLATRDALLGAVDTTAVPIDGDRLWIDRGGVRQNEERLVVNDAEVSALLAEHGFTRVDFGEYDLKNQLAMVSQASVLAGPHGSGFMHALFMPMESAVIECFSPKWLNPTWTAVYRLMRHTYFQIVPVDTSYVPYGHGTDVLIDINHLGLSMESLPKR